MMLILISSHGTDCSSIKYVPFQLTIRLSTNILLNLMSLIEITIYGFKDSSVNLLTGSYVHPEDFLKRLRFVSFTRWPYSHPDLLVTHHCFSGSRWSPLTIYNIYLRILAASHCSLIKGTILNTARQHSGTTWAILGHHLRQLGDHLESLWNYMDNILGSLGEYFDNIWALLGTTYDKHCTMHYTMRCTMQTTMHHIMHRTMQPYYSPHYPLHCTLPSVMMMISHDRALRRFSRYNFDGFCAGVLFTSRQFDELVLGWRSITLTLSFRVLQILHQPL